MCVYIYIIYRERVFDEESTSEVNKYKILKPGGKHQEKRNLDFLFIEPTVIFGFQIVFTGCRQPHVLETSSGENIDRSSGQS